MTDFFKSVVLLGFWSFEPIQQKRSDVREAIRSS